ncbi:IS110 family transposase [Pseudofrankia asymbiotica]|uniref:Transposase IS110-like N-terminal domain-containing protein n=1 Tax=Pseudofrankia asymbiotica TaxID=1834516 RepID=A0A1V2I9P8_9ACTN|nr:hypothetical protein BL253_20485 [Pseudofrankia asymbiotica]
MEEVDKTTVESSTVFCGLDVGRSTHHATALDPAGKKLHDRPLPDDEPALRALFEKLAEHGRLGGSRGTVARAGGIRAESERGR